MSALLDQLQRNARQTNAELAELLGMDEAAVAAELSRLEEEGAILGYTAVLDQERHAPNHVTAMIEVKITPEREGGFDRLASRIAKFPQVKSCFLMSGSYDLAVVVEGNDLREVARFVSEKLSSMDGIVAAATHFQLKTYKSNGHLRVVQEGGDRFPVTP